MALDMAIDRVNIARLAAPLREILSIAVQTAEAQGWQLYLVGGGVRDLLLAPVEGSKVNLTDLDLVVDGAVGAGGLLGEALRSRYPEMKLEIHGKFQTAALTWTDDPVLGNLAMDLATGRTETYDYPAANPIVVAADIHLDLARRDFSVNAMALRLTNPGAGEVLDFYQGQTDLVDKVLRILHDRSFIDDPTRLFRGARFAARLGFKFESGTEKAWRSAIGSGIFEESRSTNITVPALQTRLKAEFKYLFQSKHWKGTLRILEQQDAFQCLHPSLNAQEQLNEAGWRRLWRSLCRMDLWLREGRLKGPEWQRMLELVIAMAGCDAGWVAAQLRLDKGAIDRLTQLSQVEATIIQSLKPNDLPSQIYQVLQNYDELTLWLVAARSDDPWRCQIWKYLTQYLSVKPLLSGQDLKSMGYKPGKEFKLILDRVLMATLDGEICDRAAAIEWVRSLQIEVHNLV